QPEAAERVARKLAGLGPKGRGVLAEVLAGRGRPDEAAAEVEAAAKAGDAATAGAVALALAVKPAADPRWAALAERVPAEGAATAGRSLAEGSDPASATPDRLLQLALIYHLKRDFAKEVAVYERLLAAQPANFQFLNNMAWTLSEEMHRPEDGLKRADEAIAR